MKGGIGRRHNIKQINAYDLDLINEVLPDELLLEIMDKLDRTKDRNSVALMCTRWLKLEGVSRYSIKLHSSREFDRELDRSMGRLVLRFPHLRHVHIVETRLWNWETEFYSSITDLGLTLLGQGCPQLETLSLEGCRGVRGSGLISVAENCKQLKILGLKHVDVGDIGLVGVGRSSKLEDLHLWSCGNVTDEGLITIAKGSGESLRKLAIENCPRIGTAALVVVGASCPSLESVTLVSEPEGLVEFITEDFTGEFINDDGVVAIANCKGLRSLYLYCPEITDKALQAVGDNCLLMESFYLEGSPNIWDRGLLAIGKGCRKLRSLTLRLCENVTDDGLVAIAKGSGESLRELGIICCDRIGTAALVAVGKSCPSLERVSLESEKFMDHGVEVASRINDDGVVAIANCKGLRFLHLDCPRVTDKALQAVGDSCLWLETLSLSSARNISDRGLLAVGKGCRKLRSLTLRYLDLRGDKSLEAIAVGCRELKVLRLICNRNTGKIGLGAIGCCKGLRVFMD